MKLQSKIISVMLLLLLCSCSTMRTYEKSGDLQADLQALLDYATENSNTLGLVLMYYHPELGEYQVVSGFRDDQRNESIQPTDLYQVGSLTKVFISTVILQLIEENRLSLEDTISQFGYDFSGAQEIRVRDLLQHTSGIPDYVMSIDNSLIGDKYSRDWTEDELIELGLSSPAVTEPWNYSNTNYTLLGQIIRKVTGEEPEVEIRRRILIPLAMDFSYMRGKEELQGELIESYYYVDKSYWNTFEEISVSMARWGGGMISNSRDITRFFRGLFGGELLQDSSMELMEDFLNVSDQGGYGLGLAQIHYLDRSWKGHSGYIGGASSVSYFCEETGEILLLYSNTVNLDSHPEYDLMDLLGEVLESYLTAE